MPFIKMRSTKFTARKKAVAVLAFYAVLGVLAYAAGVYGVHLATEAERLPSLCPFRFWTSLPCPGCGMTRAFLSAAGGNWIAAWSYNPWSLLLFPGIFLTALIVASGVRKDWPRLSPTVQTLALSALLAGWILRVSL